MLYELFTGDLFKLLYGIINRENVELSSSTWGIESPSLFGYLVEFHKLYWKIRFGLTFMAIVSGLHV